MKTTKATIQEIRDATKVILLPYSAPDFARDAAIKYMEALNPKTVTALIDDLDTLETRLTEATALLERARFSHDSRFDKDFIADLERFTKGAGDA